MKKVLFLMFTVVIMGCAYAQKGEGLKSVSPQTIVYKTKADYARNVPVTLSEDRTKIVSYPAPQDLFTNGVLAIPTSLAKGYLLDNRGIGPNTAFISLTFEQYVKLDVAPSTDDLLKLIIDKDPIVQMYNLGARHQYKNLVGSVNSIIVHHKLKKFKRLK